MCNSAEQVVCRMLPCTRCCRACLEPACCGACDYHACSEPDCAVASPVCIRHLVHMRFVCTTYVNQSKEELCPTADAGEVKGVPEVHGNVRHHRKSEGHLPPPGRHLAQVPSQVSLFPVLHIIIVVRQCPAKVRVWQDALGSDRPLCGLKGVRAR